MGADGKMLGRSGYRGCCLDCDGPRGGGVPHGERNLRRGEEKTAVRHLVAEEIALGEWAPDGAWDGVSDFYEDDEDPTELLAAFERAEYPVVAMHPSEWRAARFDENGEPLADWAGIDEPLESLVAATQGPPDGVTEPPAGWAGPVYEPGESP